MSEFLENELVITTFEDNPGIYMFLGKQGEKGMTARCLEAQGDGGANFTKGKDYELIGGKEVSPWDMGLVVNDLGEEVYIWLNPETDIVESGAAPKFALLK